MGKIIAVASGKGGTGKTTTVAAMSSCLAVLGHKTLCLDFDVGMNNLDFSLGMDEFTIANFADVMEGQASIEEASRESPRIKDLYFLGAPLERHPPEPDQPKIDRMFGEIRGAFDYCFIDLPSGIDEYFTATNLNDICALLCRRRSCPP